MRWLNGTVAAIVNVADKMVRREEVLSGDTHLLVAADAVYWVTNAGISVMSAIWSEDADLRSIRVECERMVREESQRRRAAA